MTEQNSLATVNFDTLSKEEFTEIVNRLTVAEKTLNDLGIDINNHPENIDESVKRFDLNNLLIEEHMGDDAMNLTIFDDRYDPSKVYGVLSSNFDHTKAIHKGCENLDEEYGLHQGLCKMDWFPIVRVDNVDAIIPALQKKFAKIRELVRVHDISFDAWRNLIWAVGEAFFEEKNVSKFAQVQPDFFTIQLFANDLDSDIIDARHPHGRKIVESLKTAGSTHVNKM